MRFFWPAATLCLLMVLAFLYFRREGGCEVVEQGGTLHLVRSDVDTVRARFCYAADCRLIAEQMNRVERARWHCQ